MINVSACTVALGKPVCSGSPEQTVAHSYLMTRQVRGPFVLEIQNTQDAFVLET
uniref:hypothetical protein n=1 Tax=Streptomyces sp. NBC_00008 TaxID=2903610 RepID=UPI002F917BD6